MEDNPESAAAADSLDVKMVAKPASTETSSDSLDAKASRCKKSLSLGNCGIRGADIERLVPILVLRPSLRAL